MSGHALPNQIEVASSLYGCWRLFLGDERGAGYFRGGEDGFWSGAWAVVLTIPALYAQIFLEFDPDVISRNGLLGLIAEAEILILTIATYALGMFHLLPIMERESHYFTYMTAFFWMSLTQSYGWLLISLIAHGLPIPEVGVSFMMIGVFVTMLWYSWSVTRITLDINGGQAAIVVFGTLVYTTMMQVILSDLV